MTKLRVSLDLALPEDTVTSTLIVYGGKGMGKTNFGSVLVEELSRAKLRWSFLDPMGVAWGLRHSADGQGPGVECVILGGPHGDMPIEPTGGAVVADFIVDESVNVLIDFSRKPSGDMWSNGERVRFVTDYTRRLFSRQGQLVNGRRREPLFQILDEAARYIPQLIPTGRSDAFSLADCLSAWEQAVEEGRNIGLGVGLLTQRSARINKSVAELADSMIAFRTVGPNSIDAVTDWLGSHVEKGRIKELTGQVRTLPIGSALVVSPGWLGVEKVVPFRARTTFDSSATPKPGQRAQKVSGPGAKPDLEKYRERMVETIERAKADDPKELRKEIAELKKQVNAKASQDSGITRAQLQEEYRRGVADGRAGAMKDLRAIVNRDISAVDRAIAGLMTANDVVVKTWRSLQERLEAKDEAPNKEAFVKFVETKVVPSVRRSSERMAEIRHTAVRQVAEGDGDLSKSEQKILDALALMEQLNVPFDKTNLGFFAGYTEGGRFNNLIGQLRTKGYIEPARNDGMVVPSDQGRAAGDANSSPITSLDALHSLWLSKLPPSEGKVLRVLLEHYPESMTKDELGELTDYSEGGRFNNILGRLRSLGAIDYPVPGKMVATDVLFPKGLR